jgi:hypothetical protein
VNSLKVSIRAIADAWIGSSVRLTVSRYNGALVARRSSTAFKALATIAAAIVLYGVIGLFGHPNGHALA